MGGTIDSMCKCDNKNLCFMQNNEIISKQPREINPNIIHKSSTRSKDLRNSCRISRKITDYISSNKMGQIEDDNNYCLSTAKNTFPSNNQMSNRSNPQNNSSFNEIRLNSFHIEINNENNKIEYNKVDSIFEQISKIEEKDDTNKKILFNRGSKNSLDELLNTFDKKSKANNNNDDKDDEDNNEISECKESIIDDNKDKCLYNDDDKDDKDKNEMSKYKESIIEDNKEKCLYNDDESSLDNKNNDINDKKMEGNMIDEKLNGYRKYTDENGTVYEGNFEDGKLNGEGIIIKINENNNKSINLVTKNNNNKITYVGSIKNFKKEGFGKETCVEYIYEGHFHNDLKNGKGKIKFTNNGDYYEGEFTNDKITGIGKYIWANKHQYIGEFIDGEMNGKGNYKWPDGSEYTGEYINNIKEGKGEFKWSNGAVFKGQFVNGKPNGKGIMIYKNHSFDAEFVNGHFVGNLKSILKSINNLK